MRLLEMFLMEVLMVKKQNKTLISKRRADMQELEKILEEIGDIYVDDIAGWGVECNLKERANLPCDNCYECIKEVCKNIIRKHMNDGWIPVEERLPEEGGTYIITAKDGEREIISFAKWQNRYKHFDMTGKRAYWRVIAWRHLPEPYRPERRENDSKRI